PPNRVMRVGSVATADIGLPGVKPAEAPPPLWHADRGCGSSVQCQDGYALRPPFSRRHRWKTSHIEPDTFPAIPRSRLAPVRPPRDSASWDVAALPAKAWV